MAHVALYREWRPLTFDEVVEQTHVVTALRQAVITGQIAHAYLFSGTRGTGKTTVAKIFSRAINCLNPVAGNPCNKCEICTGILNGSLLDVVEMDAASNNSVDTIRRIVDEVLFMPSQARFKVYIIDEVHMLSTGAFNALLKTLEEPPAHAVFILATTEPHRIPATILSRCQRYEFRRIPLPGLISRLQEIASANKIEIEAAALDTIARLAEGGMRDAISLLDQVRMSADVEKNVTRDDVLKLTGVADDELLARMSKALLTGDATGVLEAVGALIMSGRDLARFLLDLAAYCRNLLIVSVTPEPGDLLQVTSVQLNRLKDVASLTDTNALLELVRELSALHGELRWSSDTRTSLEVGLLRLMSAMPASQPAKAPTPTTTATAKTASAVNPSPEAAPASAAATASATAPAEKSPLAEPALKSETVASVKPIKQDDFADLTGLEPPPADSDNDLAPETIEKKPVELKDEPVEDEPVIDNSRSDSKGSGTADPFFASTASNSADDDANWKAIQDQLIEAGYMTTYLYCRPAAFSFCGGELHIIFSEKDKINCQELKEPANHKALHEAATKVIGSNTPVVVRLAEDPQAEAQHCPVPEEPAWITRVREAADAFGIPVIMEDKTNG